MKLSLSPCCLCPFIGFSAPRILREYCSLYFVNRFQVSIFLEFLYFAEDLLPILFLRYCRFYFLFLLLRICFMFWFKKQFGLLHIWPIHKGRCFLRIIYSKNTKLTIIIVKAQINPIIRILIKTMDLFIIIVQ